VVESRHAARDLPEAATGQPADLAASGRVEEKPAVVPVGPTHAAQDSRDADVPSPPTPGRAAHEYFDWFRRVFRVHADAEPPARYVSPASSFAFADAASAHSTCAYFPPHFVMSVPLVVTD
jgi:hypothetical protein